MTFSNSIAQWLASDGIPVVYASNINLNNNVPVVLPSATGVFAPVLPRAGYVRVKSNIVNKNVTTKVGGIIATTADGNTINIYNGDANATANAVFYDASFFFWFDKTVSNINIVNIATTNNTATYDVEVVCMQ